MSERQRRSVSQAELKKLIHYDPVTGIFTWLPRPWCPYWRMTGSVAGSKTSKGYLGIGMNNVIIFAHVLAWIYMTGEPPDEGIDHKNRNRSDNSWNNLRVATNAMNSQNRGATKANKTGLAGVHKYGTRYIAQIASKDIGKKHLGVYDTAEEAYAAYISAKRLYHPGFIEEINR